jgi:hypothetical protein
MRGLSTYAQFLKAPPVKLAKHKHLDAMRETIAFMLDKAVGAKNAIPTSAIVSHLERLDFDMSAQKWQVEVMGPLRDNGIFIGGGPGNRGMFLIDTAADADVALRATERRITTEARRLRILRGIHQKLATG